MTIDLTIFYNKNYYTVNLFVRLYISNVDNIFSLNFYYFDLNISKNFHLLLIFIIHFRFVFNKCIYKLIIINLFYGDF